MEYESLQSVGLQPIVQGKRSLEIGRISLIAQNVRNGKEIFDISCFSRIFPHSRPAGMPQPRQKTCVKPRKLSSQIGKSKQLGNGGW